MTRFDLNQSESGGSAPATLGFIALRPEWLTEGRLFAAPAILAAESALGSHPALPCPPLRSFQSGLLIPRRQCFRSQRR